MSRRYILTAIITGFVFSGCASLSKEECATADWQAIGYADGSRGDTAARFNSHQKACAEHGYSANFANYKAGHQHGLEEVFCKPRSGYQLGLHGGNYQNVCPAYLEPEFLDAYHHGRDIYQQQHAYNELTRQRTQLNNDITALDTRIAQLEHDIHHNNHASDAHAHNQPDDDRRRIENIYHEIERLQPISKRSTALQNHLRNELAAQQQQVEEIITLHTSSKKVMPTRDKQLIRSLASDAVEQGRLQSAIEWVGSNAKAARTRTQQIAILQQQLQQATTRINQNRQMLQRYDLTSLIEQASYAGALKHHEQILAQRLDQYALDLLIDHHFQTDLISLENLAPLAQNDSRPHDHRQRSQLYRELREARHQRKDMLRELDALEHRMDELNNVINQMKSTSRY